MLVLAFGLLGAFVPVPFVALGPGPTYNTLGSDGTRPVIQIDGERTYPTKGHLNMTTVSVTDQLSIFSALGLWASGRYALAPRELYFPPNKSEQQVEQENTRAFNDSQTTAETAALAELGYPTTVRVGEIVKGSPADGILEPGDQLLAVNGQPVTDPNQLRRTLSSKAPGDEVKIQYRHGDESERSTSVRLASRSEQPRQGFLGVGPVLRSDVDFNIDISLADVGGPSAGTMFALAIIDKLTPGQLNGGEFVAGTGEISDTGQVGPIGGIPFKMAKAREAGATVFLVPAQNCAEAVSQAPEGLRLIRIGTLHEAVQALDALRTGGNPPSCD